MGLGVAQWHGIALTSRPAMSDCPPRFRPFFQLRVVFPLLVGLLGLCQPASAQAIEAEQAELTVHVQGGEGVIFLDGKEVGQGSFTDHVTSGRHELKVTRPGYEDRVQVLALREGEVHSVGVTLRQSISTELRSADGFSAGDSSSGVYGGVQLLGALEPAGAGTSLETGCDALGANRCTEGSVLGAGLSGYVGFLLAPVGLELAIMLSADRSAPSAYFDGSSGIDINPVVAVPGRTENFLIARFGGGAALRVRVVKRVSEVDFSFAAGPGLLYRVMGLTRDTVTLDGETSEFIDGGTSYLSPYISLEGAIGFRIGETTSIALGLVSWIEHAGDDTQSKAEDRVVLTVGSNPVFPQATPPYDLASGAQWFVGPFLGLSFGQ